MALRFVDGFDHYSAAQMTRKWTVSNLPDISSSYARFAGGQGLRIADDNRNHSKTLDDQATWTVGFAFKTSGLSNINAFCLIRDGATTQVDLRINATGTLTVTRNGTILATSAVVLLTNTWYYIEFKATIHNTAGAYEVRVNGAAVIGPTAGANTRATANNFANVIRLTGSSGGPNKDVDDLYICDGSGSVNNDFLGDVRVEALYPSGAGTTTQFTPSAGSNFQCVDETPANDDTDYVSSSTAGQKDTYAFGNLSSTPSSIKGVQTVLTARKDDAGTRTIAPVVRSGGTDYDGTNVNISDSYACHLQVYETNPDTSAAWTASEVDGAEFGVKLVA